MMQQQRVRWFRGGSSVAYGVTALTAAVVVLAAGAPAAHAQTPFRVLRPENGATVRETVRIQIPRRAIDEAGIKYLSISIDGKFREALAVFPTPAADKPVRTPSIEVTPKVVNVLWNTKSQTDNGTNDKEGGQTEGVPDGHHTVEIVAQDALGKRLGTQTLDLNVDNTGGMQIPADGLPLSYRFQVGDLNKYHEISTLEYLGDNTPKPTQTFRTYTSPGYRGNAGGGMYGGGYAGGPDGGPGGPGGPGGAYGRFGVPGGGYAPANGGAGDQTGPFTVQVQNVRANFERTTEDALGNGVFFIRDKAIDGIILGGNGSAARLEDVYNFKSRYRTVNSAGAVLNYGVANASHPGAYIALEIPDLGGGTRRVGQTWRVRTPLELEWATLDKPPMVTATNTLEGLEWQNGYQTAKIKQTYSGKADVPIYGGAGTMKGASVQLDRTIWFAYKSGKVIRMETDVTVDGQGPASVLSAMVPSAGISAPGGGMIGGPDGEPGGMAFPAAFSAPPGMPGMPGMPGGIPNGGFGGLQLQTPQEEQKAPAKFHSHSVVTLVIPGYS